MSSFFAIPSAQKKRKRTEDSEIPKKRLASKPSRVEKPAPRKPQRDESISGSDDDSNGEEFGGFDDDEGSQGSSSAGDDGEEETAAERRLRLAERYLDNVRTEVHVDSHGFDAEEIDRELIAERLQEDVAESKGRMYRHLASELGFGGASHSWFKSNAESITGIASCAPYAYTVSKDLWLVKWRIQDLPKDQWLPKKGKKNKKPPPPPKRRPERVLSVRGDKKKSKDNSYQGHTDIILTVACSEDGKLVVTGGKDRKIIVWDASTLKPLRVFTQHRDSVTGLAFRRGTNQLYSSSKDRTVKVWSLDELAYVETLFGHQDEVVDIAALAQERCISVGARDRTARLWKVAEETQLVYRGGGGSKSKGKTMEGSMDRVAMIDDEMFVTGGDNGSICLWTIHKKKPIHTISAAHGVEEQMASDEASAEVEEGKRAVPEPQVRWITCLSTVPYSDVVLSGSWDGFLRAWKISSDKKKLESMGVVGSLDGHGALHVGGTVLTNGDTQHHEGSIAKGVMNDISLFERGDRGKDGLCVVVAVGKEHRLGAWKKVNGKNGAVVFEIPRMET
ncbi:putative WD repeat-containing protein C2E1P5.05 [Lachnellula cervina]|uniref:Putative WD repeat-containing protein C2E1P5.05 n=1 Tax=Lachnellula cervina TaxID=1316786 RepID=A0A7D8URW4_9HELO|nr:putative WD repeat-containing protein C2E1P5.05 [Lachnellula cervina]